MSTETHGEIIADSSLQGSLADKVDSIKTDTLVVVSKVKGLIRDQAALNTSQCAVDALTKTVVAECLKAIKRAQDAGRKTVMGRDFA